jgi:Ca2+-binding EF-hand superfamily protein
MVIVSIRGGKRSEKMKAQLRSIVLALMPAAVAFAQAPVDPNNPAGAAQQPGQFGNVGGPGPRGPVGPPPNIMFSLIDSDSDGVITKTELRRAVVQLRKLDADKDGNITLAEVSPAGGPGGPWGDPAQFVQRLMAENDRNKDDTLTAAEIPDNLKPMLREADINNDTFVTREELNAVVTNMNRFPGGPGAGPWNQAGAFPGQPARGNRDNEMTGRLMRSDRDGDGKLSADELPANMRNMFQKGDDLNGDGAIDAGELQAVVQRMGDRARGLRGGLDPEDANGNRERGRGTNRRARERGLDEE